MISEHKRREYVVILFVLGVLALNYPLLAILDRMLLPLGIPLLYLYIFLIWLVIIGLMAGIAEKSGSPNSDRSEP